MKLPQVTPLAEAYKLARMSLRCLFLEVAPDVAGDVSHNVELAFQALERAAPASLEDSRARVQALHYSGKLENPAKERVRQRAIATALAAIEGTKRRLEAEFEAARPARVPSLDSAETDQVVLRVPPREDSAP